MTQDHGVTATPPLCGPSGGAVASPSPAKPAAANAIDRALASIFAWAENRMDVYLAEKLIWLGRKAEVAAHIVESLHDAGFVITPMGGDFPTETNITDGRTPWERQVRVRLQMRPVILGAEQFFPDQYLNDRELMRQHAPRILARTLLRIPEDQVAERIALALCDSGSDRNGEDAAQTAAECEASQSGGASRIAQTPHSQSSKPREDK